MTATVVAAQRKTSCFIPTISVPTLADLVKKGEKALANYPINGKRNLTTLIDLCRRKRKLPKTKISHLQTQALQAYQKKLANAGADNAQLQPKSHARRPSRKISLIEAHRFQRYYRRSRPSLASLQRK